jgi:hypothetical protein
MLTFTGGHTFFCVKSKKPLQLCLVNLMFSLHRASIIELLLVSSFHFITPVKTQTGLVAFKQYVILHFPYAHISLGWEQLCADRLWCVSQAGSNEHDDSEELVQGMCAFLMGICVTFNDDTVTTFSKVSNLCYTTIA